ncbi:hypothetical protein HMPREF1545_04171 [Oscillibacter sp. KLE 1728]|nr:hypothetical protein HMPREF1545_04171 [Oscillibacter sp. KLE 1728]ERK57363.1 hypothetical protein HMPREF1546_03991 [Oscillibacter sp. KLE 1745]
MVCSFLFSARGRFSPFYRGRCIVSIQTGRLSWSLQKFYSPGI